MMDSLSVQIGRRIRSRREALGLTREQLAEITDLSLNFFAEIESGRKNMTTKSLYKVAKALNLSADYILFGEQAQADKTKTQKLLDSLSERDKALAEDILESFVKAVTDKA